MCVSDTSAQQMSVLYLCALHVLKKATHYLKFSRLKVLQTPTAFLTTPYSQVGFKGFNISPEAQKTVVPFSYEGKDYSLSHGQS